MKYVTFIIFFLIFSNPSFAKIVYNQEIYIDNVNGSDDNDGSSWDSAFASLYFLSMSYVDDEFQGSRSIDDRIYIRATDTPYRVDAMIGGIGHFYFNATGEVNADGSNILSTKRAILYGSKSIPFANWNRLSPEGSEVVIYSAPSPFGSTLITRAYSDSETVIKLTESDAIWLLDNLQYYQVDGQVYIRSDNQHPADLSLEWISDHSNHIGIEGFWHMSLEGASLKYFTKGFIHGNCQSIEIKDLDVSYSAGVGIVVASALPSGTKFYNIRSHHNEGDGIHLHGYNNSKLFNCLTDNNAGDGIVLVPVSAIENYIPTAYLNHCTSASNSGAGVRIYSTVTWMDIYDSSYRFGLMSNGGDLIRNGAWNITNTVSAENGLGEFILENSSGQSGFLFNAWHGQNNSLFEQFKGFGNVENLAPYFVDIYNQNFSLQFISPLRDAGIYTTVTEDINGSHRDSLPDIGAYEY